MSDASDELEIQPPAEKKVDANDVHNHRAALGNAEIVKHPTYLETRRVATWVGKPSTFESVKPISTGFAAIDNALNGGMYFGGCYVIAGLTGEGKSTLAQNMAMRIAAAGLTTTIFTLEDPIEHVIRKLVASKAGVFIKRVSGEWPLNDEREIECVANVKDWMCSLPLRVEEQTETLEDIEKAIAWEAQHANAKVIVVDQSSCIEVPDVRSEYEMHAKISKSFKRLTKKLKADGFPIVLIVVNQINRTGARNRKAGLGIGMDDIRSSSTWAHDAFGVMVLDVEKSDGDMSHPCEMKIKVEKHRYGQGKDWEFSLAFYKPIQRIDDWCPEHEAAKPKEEKEADVLTLEKILTANHIDSTAQTAAMIIPRAVRGRRGDKTAIKDILAAIPECHSHTREVLEGEGKCGVFKIKLWGKDFYYSTSKESIISYCDKVEKEKQMAKKAQLN